MTSSTPDIRTSSNGAKPPLLDVQDLHTHFRMEDGVIKAANGVNRTLKDGQVLGVMGESGSGKTMTALLIMSLLPCAHAVCPCG